MKQKIVIEIDEKLKHALDRFEGTWATDTVQSNASDIAKAIANGTVLSEQGRLIDGESLRRKFEQLCSCNCDGCIYSYDGLPCKLINEEKTIIDLYSRQRS